MSISLIKTIENFTSVNDYDYLTIIPQSTTYNLTDACYQFTTYVKTADPSTYKQLNVNKYYPLYDADDTLLNTRCEFNPSRILKSELGYLPQPFIKAWSANTSQSVDYKIIIQDLYNSGANTGGTTTITGTTHNAVGDFNRYVISGSPMYNPYVIDFEAGTVGQFLTNDSNITLKDNKWNTISLLTSIPTDANLIANYKLFDVKESFSIWLITSGITGVLSIVINAEYHDVVNYLELGQYTVSNNPTYNGTYTVDSILELAPNLTVLRTTTAFTGIGNTGGTLTQVQSFTNYEYSISGTSLKNKHISIPGSYRNMQSIIPSALDAWTKCEVNIKNKSNEAAASNTITINRSLAPCNSRYGEYQLFYVNELGGWDTFTFEKKNYVEGVINRLDYQKRLRPNYNTWDRGQTNLNTTVDEVWTLNTNTLNDDAEVLKFIELLKSNEVYIILNDNTLYAVNVLDTKYLIQQAVNGDLMQYSIQIKFANRIKNY